LKGYQTRPRMSISVKRDQFGLDVVKVHVMLMQ